MRFCYQEGPLTIKEMERLEVICTAIRREERQIEEYAKNTNRAADADLVIKAIRLVLDMPVAHPMKTAVYRGELVAPVGFVIRDDYCDRWHKEKLAEDIGRRILEDGNLRIVTVDKYERQFDPAAIMLRHYKAELEVIVKEEA